MSLIKLILFCASIILATACSHDSADSPGATNNSSTPAAPPPNKSIFSDWKYADDPTFELYLSDFENCVNKKDVAWEYRDGAECAADTMICGDNESGTITIWNGTWNGIGADPICHDWRFQYSITDSTLSVCLIQDPTDCSTYN